MQVNGARIVLECLAREKVECIFGYPGGVTLPLYDALYDYPIRHVLVRHEQNACFAAEGYARATGKPGVCCATSGPGATNLVTGLVDAIMDSIPVVAITGQVSTKLIGTDAFQEADTFGITRSCTKHNFFVKTLEDLPQAMHEAFHIAATGRPGPVLVDIPKDVLQARGEYSPVPAIHLPGYKLFAEGHAGQIRRAAQMIWEAERPYVYAGGGIVAAGASEELRALVELVDAPAVCTLMGLGALPGSHPNFVSMPGMHGSYAANMGMTEADLLIALGVRFDDRVTGKLAAFAPRAKVIHVDIDPSEIGKNRAADLPIVGDVKRVLKKLLQALEESDLKARNEASRSRWNGQIRRWKSEHPFEPEIRWTRLNRSTWWLKSIASRVARRSSRAMSASTRCGRRSSFASIIRGCGSTLAGSGPWVSACRPPSERRSLARTAWYSRCAATGDFKCPFQSLRRWRTSPCR